MPVDINKAVYVEKTDTFITPAGIITFAAIAKKWKDKEKKDDDGQFAVTLILPPKADFEILKSAAAKLVPAKTKGVKSPFLDANEKLDPDRMLEGFDPKGWTMIRANTYTQRPGVIFANGATVPEDELLDEVYNGRWARMSIRPKYYDQQGNKGVKFYLHNLQLLQEGDKWPTTGGRTAPEDEFESIDVGSSEGGKAKSSDSVFD